MKIPPEIIQRLTHESDIVEIISEAVQLKKAGSNYKGLCPFHGEKSPSFVVTPHRHIFHCFGCGVGGDVISFLMKHENLTFMEAAEKLSKRYNIPLPKVADDDRRADPHEAEYKINAYAHWFFQDQFKKNAGVSAYLNERGISTEIIESFELGFAPDSFDSLLSFFRGKQVPLERAVALGLLKKSEAGKVYDFYRNRLTFPIRSLQGHVIGFGGRTLPTKADDIAAPLRADAHPAKYINSPESPIYHKSHEVFGLYQNKREISKARQIVIVEGYIDVIACVQLGVKTAVAPLGTSLTKDQVAIIKRYADDIVCMFDGDTAGQRAAAKAFATCLEVGVHPRIATLPPDKDPGDFLKGNHDKLLTDYVQNAPAAMDWFLTSTLVKTGAQTSERVRALKILLDWQSKLPDPVERLAYQKKMAVHFDMPALERNKVIENAQKLAKVPPLVAASLSGEELIILAFLRQPQLFREDGLAAFISDFENKILRDLAAHLEIYFQKDATFNGDVTIIEMPVALQSALTRILTCGENYQDLNWRDLVSQTSQQNRKRQLKEITAKIMQAELAGNTELKLQLLTEKQKLLTEKGVQK